MRTVGVAILRLEHLTKYFGAFKALDDVSLAIEEGEVFTLLGPSGCGKTTTLRCIAGLEQPDDGRIWLRDQPIVSVSDRICVPPHRRNMGMVFQSYAIWPHKTVFENVAYPLRVRRVGQAEVRRRVEWALELVGLEALADRQGPQLSGGQQQRVALARALVYEPAVLLLDEPFSNLDAKLREQMRVQLKLLLKQVAITAVFVTHDQVEALSLSNRIAVMHQGHVEQLGAPRELYERPATAFVRDFLGSTVLLRGYAGDGAQPGQVTVHLTDVPGVTLHAVAGPHSVPPAGQAVLVAVRPEDIHFDSAGYGGGPNALDGTLEALLFVGDHYECQVTLPGAQTVVLHAPRSTALREGDPVRLSVAPEGVSVWPA
ncbi:MAG TPA: ABC transporter ATP-binding protein [Chloroflexota bacterium]|nr:ABC transporter ATP-binding protein [Chloroflexota bacterium]